MQGLRKLKRVSWASDANLRQVRLFLSEESPSQVRLGGQDHLQVQAKKISALHPNGLVGDGNLPPGFEGFSPANQLKHKLAHIPLVKWLCPPKFILDAAWQVANGEESKDVEVLNQRELRVLEAVYPRQSAIPLNPTVSPDGEYALHDDQTVPLIPIIPIEEEDPLVDSSSDSIASVSTSHTSGLAHKTVPPSKKTAPNSGAGIVSSFQQDVLKAALTTIVKSNEQIDHDLLVKILSSPAILEQLLKLQGTCSGLSSVVPKPMEGPQSTLKPSGASSYKIDPSPPPIPQFSKVETVSSSTVVFSNGPLCTNLYLNSSGLMGHEQLAPPVPIVSHMSSFQSASVPSVKDLSYYKSLIQQHGGDKQTLYPAINQDSVDNLKSRDGKHKNMKPCIYFNSSKGCRNGANCVYQHDISVQPRFNAIPEMHNAKRAKLDREIRGSQSFI